MPRIIFVCTGNMCRSPMAEGILKKKLVSLGRHDIKVSSMGIHSQLLQAASQSAIQACAEIEVDISGHLSRQLEPEELVGSDLIFTMEPVQKDFLKVFFPRVADRAFLLGCWPDKDNRKGLIKDPIGGSLNEYRKTRQLLEKHIERIIPAITDMFPPSGENPALTP